MNKTIFSLSGLLCCIMLLFSCGHKPDYDAENLIPEPELIKILTEIHTGDALTELKSQEQLPPSNFALADQEAIVTKHGYTFLQFKNTIAFYKRNPNDMDKLYDDVINKLLQEETELVNAPTD